MTKEFLVFVLLSSSTQQAAQEARHRSSEAGPLYCQTTLAKNDSIFDVGNSPDVVGSDKFCKKKE
jgi:hypothetical protein